MRLPEILRNIFLSVFRRVLGREWLGREVRILAAGTLVAQGIVAVTSVLIARLYDPDDFGVLLVFCSLMDFFVVFSAFRYELAIPLASDTEDAIVLLLLSFALVFASSVVVAVALVAFGDHLVHWLGNPALSSYLLFLPLGLFMAGANQALTYWALREKHFASLSSTRVLQSGGRVAVQMLGGYFKGGPLGLIVGYIVGFGIAFVRLLGTGLARRALWIPSHLPTRAIALAKRYHRFPAMSAFSGVINSAGMTIPLLMFASFYGPTVAGWLALGQRTVTIPMLLVGQAVAQVFFSKGALIARTDPTRFNDLFRATSQNLLLLGIVPTVVLVAAGPWLFEVIFGAQWRETGRYVQVLCVGYLGQLVVGPISQTLNLLERQDAQLLWDIGRFGLNVGVLSLSCYLAWSPFRAVCIYSGAMLFGYVILFFMCRSGIRSATARESANAPGASSSQDKYAAPSLDL